MSDPIIQEIKSRLDIVPFVQQYVRLAKAGINWKGLCPFHHEKTPSFIVSPTRQTWHCFGCSKGGDIFKFVMEMDNIEFRDALKTLAERAGVELVREDPRIRSERDRLYAVSEEAAKFFQAELRRMPAVQAYLAKRGVKPETIQAFRIGYAPDTWDGLASHLKKKEFSADEFVASGLGICSEKRAGSYYDRFRNRIMFPIADANGKIVAFSGRIFENGRRSSIAAEPKYVNSPQTQIYDKSRILFGYDKAKEAIRKKGRCIVVEGQMDLVMSHQAGFTETVAVSGVALTEKHLEQLKRLADTLISSFDTDEAGESATRRSLDLAARYDFNRRVAIIPKGKDPADAILESPALWEEAVAGAESLMDFYVARAKKKFSLKTPEGKKEFSRYVLPEVAKIHNAIEKAHWVSQIAEILEIKEDAVWAELGRYLRAIDPAMPSPVNSPSPAKLKSQRLEERILAAYFLYAETRTLLSGHDPILIFATSPHYDIIRQVDTVEADRGAIVDILERVPEEWRPYLDRIIFEAEALFQNAAEASAEVAACIREVERERLKERLTIIAESINQAEKTNDPARLDALVREFSEITGLLGKLSNSQAL